LWKKEESFFFQFSPRSVIIGLFPKGANSLMARISNDEREKFRSAADAARAMLVKLRSEAVAIQEKIATCEHIIKADELFSGRRKAETESDSGDGAAATKDVKKRGKKGEVGKHIDAVLADGSSMDEPTIRQKIKEVFNVNYGRATVYTNLRRGRDEHRYIKNGTMWKLSGLVTLKTA
jgi:hypothetical protein